MKVASVMACFALMTGMVACHRPVETQNAEDAQRLSLAQIDLGAEATRVKDVDRYMSLVPEDWALHDAEGHTVTRDDLRRGALEEWTIIEKTTSISAATFTTNSRMCHGMLQIPRANSALGGVLAIKSSALANWRGNPNQGATYPQSRLVTIS